MTIFREKIFFDYSNMGILEKAILKRQRNQTAKGLLADRSSARKAADITESRAKRISNLTNDAKIRTTDFGDLYSTNKSSSNVVKSPNAYDLMQNRLGKAKETMAKGYINLNPYKKINFRPLDKSSIIDYGTSDNKDRKIVNIKTGKVKNTSGIKNYINNGGLGTDIADKIMEFTGDSSSNYLRAVDKGSSLKSRKYILGNDILKTELKKLGKNVVQSIFKK